MNFGSYIRQLRQERKLSLREFSSQIKIDHSHMSRLEKGIAAPSDRVLEGISKTLGLSQDELWLAAGRLPSDINSLIQQNPRMVLSFLREQAAIYNTRSRPILPLQFKSVLTTQLGKLYQCDCLDFLPTLKESSVDCIFADPPFNLKKNYGTLVDDNLSESKYLEWSYQWLIHLVRVLKPGGSLFVYNLPKWSLFYGSFLSKHLNFRHWIAIDIKASLPIPGRLYPSHYSLLYFTKGKPAVFQRPRIPVPQCRHCHKDIKDYGGHRKYLNPEGLNVTDVWNDIPPVRHHKYKTRGANELSIKLLQRVLNIATKPGDLVLDPFGGAGTTFYTAETMDRRWVGCEIEDCEPIIRRLGNITIQKDLSRVA